MPLRMRRACKSHIRYTRNEKPRASGAFHFARGNFDLCIPGAFCCHSIVSPQRRSDASSIVAAVMAAHIAQLNSRYRLFTHPLTSISYAIRNAPRINLVASHPRCVCLRFAESHLFVAPGSPNDLVLGGAAVEVSRLETTTLRTRR